MEQRNGALQLVEKKELAIVHEFGREQIDLIKQTVAKGTTDNELKLFLYTAKRTGLDPLLRQIHAVKRGDQMNIQTGIDGYRLIADRTGKYAGNDDYEFDEFDDEKQIPKWAKARVWKMVEGQRCAFEATARWSQYYPGDKQGFMWRKMPHVMLGKCAEALALRKAFPAEMAGVYTAEEMAQAGEVKEDAAPVQQFTPESQPAVKAEVRDGIETAVIVATDVKHFKTKNSEFYKVMDTEGALYRTFDKKQAEIAKEAVGTKTKLRIHYKVHPQFGPNLVNLEPVYEDVQHTELLREVAREDEGSGFNEYLDSKDLD